MRKETLMNNIDFEKDQQDAIKKTDNIQSLADQVERLENVVTTIEAAEENIKLLKKNEIIYQVKLYLL